MDLSGNKRSLTVVELISVICVIFIFMGIFAIYAGRALRIARELALRNELQFIRMSIENYRIINNRFPDDLFTLMNQHLTYGGNDTKIIVKQFLKPFRVDQRGYLLDPFMNRYGYNKAEGAVYSETKGYERW